MTVFQCRQVQVLQGEMWMMWMMIFMMLNKMDVKTVKNPMFQPRKRAISCNHLATGPGSQFLLLADGDKRRLMSPGGGCSWAVRAWVVRACITSRMS